MTSSEGFHPIRRALISVFDKTGLAELAAGLHQAGVEIVSTGSTAARIAQTGVPVTAVEQVTEFPEMLDGRVKTLHPRIHGGILADRDNPEHVRTLDDHGIAAFDLVVVNLYPFAETVASGAAEDEIIEKIDIGGPSMVRAATKNHSSVAIVVDPCATVKQSQPLKAKGSASLPANVWPPWHLPTLRAMTPQWPAGLRQSSLMTWTPRTFPHRPRWVRAGRWSSRASPDWH